MCKMIHDVNEEIKIILFDLFLIQIFNSIQNYFYMIKYKTQS